MAPTQFLLALFLLSFLISLSSPLPTETLREAPVVLSNSGYLSMSLTLDLVSDSLIPHSPSLTIFSPSDAAFKLSGQPSLSLLQFHFSPLSFPLKSLKSLAPGAKIPTLSANRSLTINSNGDNVSLNGVPINGSPIYDDGSLVIFGIDKFFDPDFGVLGNNHQGGSGNLGCPVKATTGYYSFKGASLVLKSKGYSVMASFLDMQLGGFKDGTVLTIFAPVDQVTKGSEGNTSEYSSIFLRHVIPCKILWDDLVKFGDGVVLETSLEGFGITVSSSGSSLMLNEVAVSYPDLYQNDWLVVHGLGGMMAEPESNSTHRSSSVIGSVSEYSLLNDDEFEG